MALLFVLSGCMATSGTSVKDQVTVDGMVTVQGAEPFTGVVLTTADRNSYVLVLTPEQRAALATPARLRVTGRLHAADWRGMLYAHIDVASLESLDQ